MASTSMTPAIQVRALDHLVLVVDDPAASAEWYRDHFGVEVLRLDEFNDEKVSFPSLRLTPDTIIDLFARGDRPAAGASHTELDHFCLTVAPTDLAAVAESGDFDVLEGPVPRWGARGMGTSLYVRDPDGHTVELRYYDGD